MKVNILYMNHSPGRPKVRDPSTSNERLFVLAFHGQPSLLQSLSARQSTLSPLLFENGPLGISVENGIS